MNRNSGFVLTLAASSAVLGLALRSDTSIEPGAASKWAGEYFHRRPNSTMSLRLVITRKNRFSLSMGGCFGSSEINHGSVAYRDGALVLDDSSVMIPGQSGGSLFLVSADGVAEFVRESGI